MAKTYANALAALQAGNYATTINGQIERIEDSQVVIIHKTDELGLTPGANDKISDAALALDGVVDRGTPVATIDAGSTYTIQAGYYHGGTVSYQQGGSDYQLQNKTATPTKSEQVLGPDDGYYGLRQVTINPIPVAYQDVTIVTQANYATAGDILTGKSVVGRDGNEIAGSMPNRGAVSETLTAHKTSGTYDDYSYTIPAGYHNGSGTVSISLETVSVTPTESAQTITPTSGKVIGEMSVAAIDKDTYLTDWTDNATASASMILATKTAYIGETDISGHAIATTGTMPNRGAVTKVLKTTEDSYTITEGYHNGSGTVSVGHEDKTISWSDIVANSSSWTLTPATAGNFFETVTIAGKPANWVDTSTGSGETAATDGDILASRVAFVNGAKKTGTIATVTSWSDDVSSEILAMGSSGGELTSFNEAFYKNGGSVTMDGTLFARLAAI